MPDNLNKTWGGEIRSHSTEAALRDAFVAIETAVEFIDNEPDPAIKLQILLDVISEESAKIRVTKSVPDDSSAPDLRSSRSGDSQ